MRLQEEHDAKAAMFAEQQRQVSVNSETKLVVMDRFMFQCSS